MKEIKLTKCRVCEGEDLDAFLSLGMMPPINKFLKSEEDIKKEEFFPLDVVFCKNCSHVQLCSALDPEETFGDYIYFSSNSSTFVEHGQWLARELKQRLDLKPGDLVVEAASNDGVFLKAFKALPTRVLGVEPAKNIAEVAERAGIPTIADFFGVKMAEKIVKERGKAKVFLGANVLAHAFNLRDFVRGIKILLAEDGTAVIEAPYIYDIIKNLEFDTIYHEHISYFSLYSLTRLFEIADLKVYNVKYLPIHGGSLMVSIEHKNGPHPVSAAVSEFLANEKTAGLEQLAVYKNFARRVSDFKIKFLEFLKTAKENGKTVGAYGAAAKGNVLLQYCGVGANDLPYIADKSPYKQGLFTPGSHIPVVAPEEILRRKPDYLLILAWNFAKEIMAELEAYGQAGGKFVTPIPEPKIINVNNNSGIDGVLIKPLKKISDERGTVMHMLKSTDQHFEKFGEIYFSTIYPGAIKGWHVHSRMVINYAVPVGRIKLVLFDARDGSPTKGEIQEIFIGEDNYCLVKVPVGVVNGFKAVGGKMAVVANCATIPHDSEETARIDPFSPSIPYKWDIKHG